MKIGYNKGDSYEEKIFQICVSRGIVKADFKRGGAGNSSDIEFNHLGTLNKLEVKADLKADFGQKKLRWEKNLWQWSIDDEATRMYTQLGILKTLQDRGIEPRKYTIPKLEITSADRNIDQRSFELSIPIGTERLFLYYNLKDCHYIQIGGYGFYYLDHDPLNLRVPQFDGKLKLRLRAKTIHSFPVWNYGFYAVLKISSPPTPSRYDLEAINDRVFPPITASQEA